MRVGTASELMSQQMIEEKFATRTRNSIGRIRANRQDVSFEQRQICYQAKKKTSRQKQVM